MAIELIERQARYLAEENRRSEPDIERVYWFPDDEEIRLVEVTRMIPISGDGWLHPYYFPPSPKHELTAPSGIAMIRPEEFGRLKLPAEWGGWDRARLLEESGK